MSARAALLALLLAGCAAPQAGVAPRPDMPSAGLTSSRAAFAAARPGLRRIGDRNCDGFAMELFAPARMTRATLADAALWLGLRAYQPSGGGYSLNAASAIAGARLDRQADGRWQPVAAGAAAPASDIAISSADAAASAVFRLPLSDLPGLNAGLAPGHYRLWFGAFTARDGAGRTCRMNPMWRFDLE